MLLEIDGSRIKTESDFHEALMRYEEVPGWYGCNRNALWDLVTGVLPRPLTVIWKNSHLSHEHMGNDYDAIVEIFREAEARDKNEGILEAFVLRLE